LQYGGTSVDPGSEGARAAVKVFGGGPITLLAVQRPPMGWVRRSGRIAKEIRILLLGMDTSGTVFSEETRTVTLSRHGAGILSKHKLAPEGLLIMRFSGGTAETAIRLVGQLGEDARGFVYGVAFVDENHDFWELKFPPPPIWNVDLESPMQCGSCMRCEVVDQSEVEADVYALSQSILRYCIYCGTPTVWKMAPNGAPVRIGREGKARESGAREGMAVEGMPLEAPVASGGAPAMPQASGRPSASVVPIREGLKKAAPAVRGRLAGAEVIVADEVPAPSLPPAALAVVAKAANRRRDVRTRVNFSACIRHDAAEEVVECANLSRRGFAFRSRKHYPVGGKIEAAVPFYPGTPPTFVTALVRHVAALPNNNFQYGVMYAASVPPAHEH
jgi:hypothetical protein